MSESDFDRLLFVLSHELPEPVRKINSFLQILKMDLEGKLDEQQTQYIEFAVDGAKRMQAMLEQLLFWSRIGRRDESPKQVDLNEIVEYVAQEARGTVTHDQLPTVLGDENQFHRLISEIVTNGLLYNQSASPTVHVSIGESEPWAIRFQDNGIGIAKTERESVFELARRLHGRSEYPGAGIGLAIARAVAQRWDGTLAVVDCDEGACIEWTLGSPSL